MSNMPGNNTTKSATVGTAGRRVGEWLLSEFIGGGAFGEVWKARHHVWADQLAAVKLPTDPQYVRALQREGTHAHRLEHANIVRPLGFDPFAETPYLVMEYVPGRDLRGLMRDKGKLSPDEATAVMTGVLSALQHAHAKGIVHRDIKPENILIHERGLAAPGGLLQEGVVKVTDFGLGQASNDAERAERAAGGGGNQSIVFSTDVGGAGSPQIAGSLDYMAPEQRRGGDVDGRADLYACGVVLYEMLTGERPAGTDVPSDLNKGVPPRLDEAFRRSYSRLERRFGDAGEFMAALAKSDKPLMAPPPLPVKAGASAPGKCPACHGRVDKGDQFCMHCGHQVAGLIRRCGKCGAFPAADDSYCIFCGQDLRPNTRRADVMA